MRSVLAALVFGIAGAALMPSHSALAWRDGYGRWHPNHYRPPLVVAPGPYYARPYYARPYYARPYARWIPPHYNPWGRFVPGHWA